MPYIEETLYRPPLESGSLLLEVTIGCSYSQCTFCTYNTGNIALQLIPRKLIGQTLLELSTQDIENTNMFFLGGNVLALSTSYLLDLISYIKTYLPQIQHFRMYARADDILQKSSDELSNLRNAGVDILYVGIESGNDTVLKLCHKGESRSQYLEALKRLDNLHISYGVSSILGLGGKELSKQNAIDTATLYNELHPVSIRIMTLTALEGTPLFSAVEKGLFHLMDNRSILEEELILLQNLHFNKCNNCQDCLFVANHVSNVLPLVGYLPTDQDSIIDSIQHALTHMDFTSLKPNPLDLW